MATQPPGKGSITVEITGNTTISAIDWVRLLAEAWDDGFDAGHSTARAVNPEYPEVPDNPYRPVTSKDY